MPSQLLSDVAAKILNDSLKIKKGETITIETWNTGLPLAKEVTKQARKLGGIPITIFEDETTYVDGVRNTPKDVLGLMGKHEYSMLASTDAYVFIPGPPLGAYYKRITREDYANATRYNSSWYEAAEKAKLRGVRLTFGYVGKDLAGFLGKKAEDVASTQLKGVLADFRRIGSKGRGVSSKLEAGATATLLTEGSELSLRLSGGAVVEDGLVDKNDVASGENVTYLPPGLVSVDVDKGSASGTVKLSPSLTRLGIADPLTLEFSKGRLVSWSSKKPVKFIDELLRPLKEPDRVISLLTVGLNDKLDYGFGSDRFVEGSLGMSGFGFVGIVRNGTLKVDGATIVSKGRLA